jgi:hypothetical protein
VLGRGDAHVPEVQRVGEPAGAEIEDERGVGQLEGRGAGVAVVDGGAALAAGGGEEQQERDEPDQWMGTGLGLRRAEMWAGGGGGGVKGWRGGGVEGDSAARSSGSGMLAREEGESP